ncbi:MAG: hotdog fold thioesterase [bacterium]|nr:hotdog fold thioesterase [bacterium]
MSRSSRAADLLADDPYAQSLGIRMVEVTDETITVEMDVTESHLNFAGTTHGGVVFSVADCAFSLASNVPGGLAVAIDAHLVLSAATVADDRLIAQVEELTRGRTLATYRVIVTRARDNRICGSFTGTVYLIGDK